MSARIMRLCILVGLTSLAGISSAWANSAVRSQAGVHRVQSYVVRPDQAVLATSDLEIISVGDIVVDGPIIGHNAEDAANRAGVNITLRSATRIVLNAIVLRGTGQTASPSEKPAVGAASCCSRRR